MNGNRLSVPMLGGAEARPVLISKVGKDHSIIMSTAIIIVSLIAIVAMSRSK